MKVWERDVTKLRQSAAVHITAYQQETATHKHVLDMDEFLTPPSSHAGGGSVQAAMLSHRPPRRILRSSRCVACTLRLSTPHSGLWSVMGAKGRD